MTRWLLRIAILLSALLLAAAATVWWLLRGSLPALDGAAALPGLSAPVRIERDALGVVTIDAGSEADAMRALGYAHAQERYFEMDLLRRAPAGELAALFGRRAVDIDRQHRVHRMRARVDAQLDDIAGDRMAPLQAYAEGANAGLAGLRVRPWPYLLLRRQPEPWRPADSALAGHAMYFDLQDAQNRRELALWRIRPHLPAALFDLLVHDGSRWDAPLTGNVRGDAHLPAREAVDLRTLPAPDAEAPPRLAAGGTPGSNNFAVSGALTADGRAIVADDMHLGLRAPNIWFRARLRYPDARAPGGRVDVQGFTLPGLPAVIVGSNGHVAWGFTNSYGDYLDWRRETPCADAAAQGCAAATTHREIIHVAGAADIPLDVRETDWGPVLHDLPGGDLLSLRWVAHLPGAINFGLAGFAHAGDLDAALAIADRTATPTQNLVVGDASGRIAWRLLGPIPVRSAACTGRDADQRPAQHAGDAASAGTAQATDPRTDAPGDCPPWGIGTALSPRIVSPDSGRLWTANGRVVDDEALARIGDGGYALGARGQRIRDLLAARTRFTEQDLLAIQLDDSATVMTPWWTLLRRLDAGDRTPALHELADAAKDWQGRAAIDTVDYRIVRAWRLAVHARIAEGLLAPARAALGDDFAMPDLPQFEGVAWPLASERPAHLLSRRYASWEALFEDAAREVLESLTRHGPLDQRTWGERNTASICHPLAAAIPLLGRRLLCMPADPLPGDGMMPRVQGPDFGASQRMVVAPGHEADGIVHMPGGQSGHPLSPFWGAGHDDWVHGRPSAFLPGERRHALTLSPPP